MKVQTIEVFDQDVLTVDGEQFFTVRAEYLGFLERHGSPEVLRFNWTWGTLDVGWNKFLADGARLAGGAIGWPAPAVP